MRQAIICYVPAIHQGYIALFEKYPHADIYVIPKTLIKSLDPAFKKIDRDFRVVDSELITSMLSYGLHPRYTYALTDLYLLEKYDELILPEDEVSDALQKVLPAGRHIVSDTKFLRWDWKAATAVKSVEVETEITREQFHQEWVRKAVEVAEKSSDWWRHVGGVALCTDGTVLTGFNEHMPHPESVYINGDPRSNLDAGELPECCTAIHGETSIIAAAARRKDVSTEGASLYVTTFPCPVCARIIAVSGFATVYFLEPYSRLDAKEILDDAGIKLVKVLLET